MPITTAQNWKSKSVKAVELELPSGLTVLVQRPPLHLWIAAGKLPENLVKFMFAQTDGPPGMAQGSMQTPEQFRDLIRFMRETVVATVISPRITETPSGDDEISPDDVPLEDANFIFRWAMAGGALPAAEKKSEESGVMQIDVSDLRQFRSF